MKKLTWFSLSIIIVVLSWGEYAFGGDVFVNGYTRKNGVYVQPHYRSSPNSNVYDNWSTKGNVNPYTGKMGAKNPGANWRGFVTFILIAVSLSARTSSIVISRLLIVLSFRSD